MFISPFSQRVIAGTAGSVSWQQLDGLGEPADPGTVTVSIVRADGTAVVTDQATSGSGTEPRSFALSVAQTVLLDRLTVLWRVSGVTVATTEVDVAAAPWFSNAELRAAEPALENTVRFTPEVLAVARLQVETFFEQITHRRFVPGYALATLPGPAGYDLVLPHPDVRSVRSAELFDDLAQAAVEVLGSGELAAIPSSRSGVITRRQGSWRARWVRVGFEWGFIAPPPDVRRNAMRLVREVLVNEPKGQIPDNATNWTSNELGWSAVLVTPGVRGAHTRLPSVNKCLDDWTFESVGVL